MKQVYVDGGPAEGRPAIEVPIGECFKRRTGAHYYMRVTDKVSRTHEVQCVSLVTGKPDHVNATDIVLPAKVGFVVIEAGAAVLAGASHVTTEAPDHA